MASHWSEAARRTCFFCAHFPAAWPDVWKSRADLFKFHDIEAGKPFKFHSIQSTFYSTFVSGFGYNLSIFVHFKNTKNQDKTQVFGVFASCTYYSCFYTAPISRYMNILSCPFTGQEASWNRNLFTANQKKNFPRPDNTDASGNRKKEIRFISGTHPKKENVRK